MQRSEPIGTSMQFIAFEGKSLDRGKVAFPDIIGCQTGILTSFVRNAVVVDRTEALRIRLKQ